MYGRIKQREDSSKGTSWQATDQRGEAAEECHLAEELRIEAHPQDGLVFRPQKRKSKAVCRSRQGANERTVWIQLHFHCYVQPLIWECRNRENTAENEKNTAQIKKKVVQIYS